MEWFIMENSIKMDDLGVPPFKETPIWNNILLVEEILHQLIGGLSWFINVYHTIYKVLYIPAGAGFLPSTVFPLTT